MKRANIRSEKILKIDFFTGIKNETEYADSFRMLESPYFLVL